MAEVVFLRGVNVGGARKLQPSQLARALARYDVVSLGAAGTFVVRARVGKQALREAIAAELPFATEILTCSGKELLALVAAPPFAGKAPPADVKWYVTVVDAPIAAAKLPLDKAAGDWQVRVVAVAGCFVCSLHRRRDKTLVYPNEVVEKSFGVTGTTRNWATILAVAKLLDGK